MCMCVRVGGWLLVSSTGVGVEQQSPSQAFAPLVSRAKIEHAVVEVVAKTDRRPNAPTPPPCTQIDTWDTETAYFYVNNVLEWQKTMGSADGSAVCGSTSTGSNELFVPVKLTFAHYGQTVTFKVSAVLSSAATDESWGIANFKVTTSMDSCTSLAWASDFVSDGTTGWTIQNAALAKVSTCDTHAVLGGYADFGIKAKATTDVSLGSANHGVIVAFTYLKVRCAASLVESDLSSCACKVAEKKKQQHETRPLPRSPTLPALWLALQLDTWDGTEAGQLYADGVLVWSEVLASTGTVSSCGLTVADNFASREIDLGWVNGDTVQLMFTSTIDSAGTDESCACEFVNLFTHLCHVKRR